MPGSIDIHDDERRIKAGQNANASLRLIHPLERDKLPIDLLDTRKVNLDEGQKGRPGQSDRYRLADVRLTGQDYCVRARFMPCEVLCQMQDLSIATRRFGSGNYSGGVFS